MKNFIFTPGENWFKGEIILRYNLQTLFKLLLFIIILPFMALYYLGKTLWKGICWIAKHLWPLLCWIGLLILAFWAWLKGLFARTPKISQTPQQTKRNSKKWLWLLLLLLLLLGTMLIWKSCTNREATLEQPNNTPTQVYDNSFDKVIVARAYLDGVQNSVAADCPRALVGFKFINDQKVKDFNFSGMTYEQAIQVVANDWKPLVVNNLSPDLQLTEQQMAVVTLIAMRMGKYGFPRSTFLRKVNEGDFAGATEWILLQKKNGEIRSLGEEPTQYFYILKLLWNEEIKIDELLDLPMFSYRALPLKALYGTDGTYIYNEDISSRLQMGFNQSPRKALEL